MTREDSIITRAIDAWCETPFRWGVSDCILSVADILRDLHGYDPAAPYRGRYKTLRGALRVTRAEGGFAGAVIAAAFRHGWHGIHTVVARNGDVGLAHNIHGLRIGAVRYGPFWLARLEGPGFRAFADADIDRAWSVR